MKTILIVCSMLTAIASQSQTLKLDEKFIATEIAVESGGNDNAVGDSGRAIGCLQIHRSCWLDSKVPGDYTNCFNRAYSIKVMNAYLIRHEKQSVIDKNYSNLARCWNNGPNWRKNPHATDNYWNKVKKQMK